MAALISAVLTAAQTRGWRGATRTEQGPFSYVLTLVFQPVPSRIDSQTRSTSSCSSMFGGEWMVSNRNRTKEFTTRWKWGLSWMEKGIPAVALSLMMRRNRSNSKGKKDNTTSGGTKQMKFSSVAVVRRKRQCPRMDHMENLIRTLCSPPAPHNITYHLTIGKCPFRITVLKYEVCRN